MTRSTACIRPLAIACCLAVTAARAAPADTYASMFDALFDTWAVKSQPDTAILVVRKAGKVFARGHGVRPDSLSLIGSMSKPITAACIATLLRDGKLLFTTPMREALSAFFRSHGRPSDP